MSPSEFDSLYGDDNEQRPPIKELASLKINPKNFRKLVEENDSLNLEIRKSGLLDDMLAGLEVQTGRALDERYWRAAEELASRDPAFMRRLQKIMKGK
jgi:uncharacterized protein YdcH (DUF465 family)